MMDEIPRQQNGPASHSDSSTSTDGPQLILPKYHCDCDKKNEDKLRLYYDDNDALIGTFCNGCEVESVISKYVSGESRTDDEPGKLHRNKSHKNKRNTFFKRQIPDLEVKLNSFADYLKPGDHIQYKGSPYLHHAIVTEVNRIEKTIKVIEWIKSGPLKFKITEDDPKVVTAQMYRVEYPEDVNQNNPPELILARARSRLRTPGNNKYHLLFDNCESYASFCRCGDQNSHQKDWWCRRLKEWFGNSVVVTFYKSTAKTVLNGKRVAFISVGMVIVLKSFIVFCDLKSIYKERNNGKLTNRGFIELCLNRLVQEFVPILFKEFPIGMAFGTVVGGLVTMVIAPIIGDFIGSTISSTFKADDRAVMSIYELNPGDHIVTFEWCLHPRCHAIVVDLDNENENIRVIRNTYENGVVEITVRFKKPLYKVEYDPDQCHTVEVVLQNARLEKGKTNRYSLARYNCKTFARQCKMKTPKT